MESSFVSGSTPSTRNQLKKKLVAALESMNKLLFIFLAPFFCVCAQRPSHGRHFAALSCFVEDRACTHDKNALSPSFFNQYRMPYSAHVKRFTDGNFFNGRYSAGSGTDETFVYRRFITCSGAFGNFWLVH